MSSAISTKQRLLCQLEEIGRLLNDLSEKFNRKSKFEDIEHLILLLIEQDKEYKTTLITATEQMETQIKIEKLKADCASSDAKIQLCQKQLKKSELLLSTALYYCRQKLDSMVDAVKNPIDVEEIIKFSHRISSSYGAHSPDNWTPGDPRRPYPNKEEIRRGYLAHLDDSGKFMPTLREAIVQMQRNTPASTMHTPTVPGTTPNQMGNTLPSTAQCHNPLSVPPGINENPFTSPSIGLPGVNMVSSPGMAPSSGCGGVGGHWSVEAGGAPVPLPHPPSYPAGRRNASSLVAMLTSGGPPECPSPHTPSRTQPWQQMPPHAAPTPRRFVGGQQQQPMVLPAQRKRHIPSEQPQQQRMYSDESSDDEAGGGRGGQQYQQPPPSQGF